MKDTTNFGFDEVKTEEKQTLVNNVFDSVANKYDLMNDIMSFSIHRLWKKYVIKHSGVQPTDTVLDIAGGTGNLALQFNKIVAGSGKVILADINNRMLTVGRDNIIDNGVTNIDVVQTNAENLAFKNECFDVVSIAFGLRNLTDKRKALGDFYRVLKPQATLIILEFSHIKNSMVNSIYEKYSLLLPKIGKLVVGDEKSYQYLVDSIKQHPDQESLKQMVIDAGFSSCQYHNLSGGIVAMHKAIK